MTANPLMNSEYSRAGVGRERIEQLARDLNRSPAMRQMGRDYFVAAEDRGDGTIRYALSWRNLRAA